MVRWKRRREEVCRGVEGWVGRRLGFLVVVVVGVEVGVMLLLLLLRRRRALGGGRRRQSRRPFLDTGVEVVRDETIANSMMMKWR